jgi:hypothetical protein
MNAAAMRLELVARLFAETGVKQLFLMVHRMVRKYYTKPDIIRLRNKWVEVDPRTWANRKDMTINVGLGTGNRDAQLSHLMTILAAQKEAMAGGLSVVNESNLYNALVKLTQNAGFKHPELFWTDPKTAPPKPPRTDPAIEVEKMKIHADQQKFAAESQMKQAEQQMQTSAEIQKTESQIALSKQESQAKLMQEQIRMEAELDLERDKMLMEAELEKFKASLKAETDLKIANMQAEMQAQEMRYQMLNDERNSMIDQSRHAEKIAAMSKPKKVVFDKNGRVQGIE